MVPEMEAPEDLHGLREIAVRGLKSRGPRMDAVFYLLDAMRLFRGKSLQEIQEITFEIGMRFLTDYLSGDTYFRTHRSGHNLDRCRTQFKLVESIEDQEDAMNSLLERVEAGV